MAFIAGDGGDGRGRPRPRRTSCLLSILFIETIQLRLPQVLVATDVAARGLDIRALPYVVNYDFPGSLATYVHRVGRTGRLAAHGHAYSFFTRNLVRGEASDMPHNDDCLLFCVRRTATLTASSCAAWCAGR